MQFLLQVATLLPEFELGRRIGFLQLDLSGLQTGANRVRRPAAASPRPIGTKRFEILPDCSPSTRPTAKLSCVHP